MPRSPRLTKKFSKPALSRLRNGDLSPQKTPEKPQTTRLDHYLVEKYPEFNRSTLQKLIKDSQVKVDGEVITKPNFLLSGTETVDFTPPTPTTLLEKPILHIIYEDDNVLVLDKPAGLLSMSKGDHNPEPTLEDYGILVHRLDRDTSGVVILAKNESTRSQLQKQFQQRKTHKTYYAITKGTPTPPHAIINVPITRNLSRPSTFRTDPRGREAITEYEVMDTKNDLSLVKLQPTTGRTHQLRVHLAHLGTPILGDPVYSDTIAPRMYLHATALEITIPGGHRMTFESPLPEDFQNALG